MAKASITQGAPAVPTQPADSVATEPLAGAAELESFMAGHLEATFDPATPPKQEKRPATVPQDGPEDAEPPTETDGDTADTDTDDDEPVSLSDLLEDTEEETDTDDTETDDDEPKDGETPAWVQKRLSKMSEQKREWKSKAEQAEARARQLETDLESAKAAKFTLQPSATDPLADVQDESTLATRLQTARAALEWLDENADGGVLEHDGKEIELSAGDVAKRRRFFESLINQHAPARKAWLASQQAAREVAKAHYAPMYKEATRMAKVREGMLTNIPGLATRPDADVFVGDAYVGALVRTGELRVFRNDAKAKPAPEPKPATPAKPAAHSPATTGPATQKARAADALLQKAAKTGSRADLAGALEAMLE